MRVLLLKAEGQFKHSGKYALINGRWKKLHPDQPHPKGAPLAHHPQSAAGKPVSLTADQIAQLKYPEDKAAKNKEMAAFNNVHLPKLLAHGEKGDATALLGHGYGTNTHSKKQVAIANYLLSQMGSEHKVEAGQAAGSHPAVQTRPTTDPQQQLHDMLVATGDIKPADQPAPSVSAETVTAPSDKGEASKFDDTYGKAKYYDDQAAKVQAMADAGDTAGLAEFKEKNKDKAIFGGKTKNSQIFLKLWDELTAGKTAEPAAAPETEAKPEPKAAAAEPDAAPDTGYLSADQLGKLQSIPWFKQKLPDSNTNAKSHNAAVAKIEAMAFAGDQAWLQAFIDGKAGAKQTYAKKQALLAQTALAALKDGGSTGEQAAAIPEIPELKTQQELTNWANSDAFQSWNAAGLAKYGSQKAWNESEEQAKFNSLFSSLPEQADDKPSKESASGSKPQKPDFPAGSPWETHLKHIDAHADDVEWLSDYAKNSTYPNPGPSSDEGKAALAYVQELLAAAGGATAQDEKSPQEGDTKEGADGTLVFRNGRWHKQEQAAEAETKHPVDDMPEPDISGFSSSGQATVKSALQILKDQIKSGDLSGLKGATKKMGTGNFIVKLPNPSNPIGKITVKGKGPGTKSLYEYVETLKVAAGKPPKKAAAPKPEPQPQQASPEPQHIESMDNWIQTGPQGGSNPGGKFKDENGVEWYCKFPGDEDVAKSEVLAAKLYAAAGVAGQDAKLVTKDGKLGIASKWQTVQKGSASQLAKAKGALSGFAVDAWLANWDVVGLGLDNMQMDEAGNAVRVDAGGSLQYRAQGGKKAFGTTVSELDSLRDAAINPQAASVFGKMTDADIAASVAKVLSINNDTIAAMVNTYGPGSDEDKKKIIDTLIARKADLAAKYPSAKKQKAKNAFNPDSISAPPNFNDWNGSGKGLSSKHFVNEANQAAVDAVYSAAKKGDLPTIKNVQAPIFNKDSGAVVSHVALENHPSQHVKAYWQDMVNEVDLQLNPPRPPEVGVVVTSTELGEISSLLKSVPSGDAVAATSKHKKIGDYIILGQVKDPDFIMPKTSNTVISSDSWKSKVKSAYESASSAAKAVFSAYLPTSGARALNSALRKGDLSSVVAGKSVAEHVKNFKGLLVDIPEGSTFVRRMGMKGYGSTPNEKAIKALQQFLMTAEKGTVVQEPAFSSTSWTGGNTILGNNDIEWQFTAAKGVKMFPAWLTTNKSEGEGLLPPNQRYMIVGAKKIGKTVQVEAILLPTTE